MGTPKPFVPVLPPGSRAGASMACSFSPPRLFFLTSGRIPIARPPFPKDQKVPSIPEHDCSIPMIYKSILIPSKMAKVPPSNWTTTARGRTATSACHCCCSCSRSWRRWGNPLPLHCHPPHIPRKCLNFLTLLGALGTSMRVLFVPSS